MIWYSIGTTGYSRRRNRGDGSSHKNIRILRYGEVFSYSYITESGDLSEHFRNTSHISKTTSSDDRRWKANDESISHRQVSDQASFFHFRNWDDYVSKGLVQYVTYRIN
jgi:hypothetical protein